jgi:hypothetical protein
VPGPRDGVQTGGPIVVVGAGLVSIQLVTVSVVGLYADCSGPHADLRWDMPSRIWERPVPAGYGFYWLLGMTSGYLTQGIPVSEMLLVGSGGWGSG